MPFMPTGGGVYVMLGCLKKLLGIPGGPGGPVIPCSPLGPSSLMPRLPLGPGGPGRPGLPWMSKTSIYFKIQSNVWEKA